jgi:phosphoribosylaminoimidazolecarboxamide formyltransferase/IMP cyclohydrolase
VVCGELTPAAKADLVLGLVTLKYTQSNSVGYSRDGQMIGIGAGQQSRVDCTKLAGGKADIWYLRCHPKVLGLKFKAGVGKQARINFRVGYIEGDLVPAEIQELREALDQPLELLTDEEKRAWMKTLRGVSLTSDGFLPFRDNVDHASKHGVSFIAQPGGSTRDEDVIAACREHGISMARTGVRLFHH